MRVIDSHTAGEPTRVIVEGGPDLGNGSLPERLALMKENYDHIRKSIILEPRGSDVLVGALLCPATNPKCSTGVIFFNNSGYLGMCGHGTIGVAVTLAHLGLVSESEIKIETPVGVVTVKMLDKNTVSVENVESHLYRENVSVQIDELGTVTGDVAWGGNWFFLAHQTPVAINLENEPQLRRYAKMIKLELNRNNITGQGGAEIDHIEFFSTAEREGANSKNYVLCPGDAYDRSPCGTGTSAKLAALAAKGLLAENETWVQDSIINSRFEAKYRRTDDGKIIPTIIGKAYISAESTLIFDPKDPFKFGI
ncbi:proline racemase family protein [Kangiella sp. HZ709]|uniref:proline racemase family protein n=1 Tax=Kangiella sp. HZ709 TaxID=2666328 RepID=UPI00351B7182